MAIRVAINGFGRIGRNVLRAGWGRGDIEFVGVNDLAPSDALAYLLKRDSVHGTWAPHVRGLTGGLEIDGAFVPATAEADPARLDHSGVDVVLECSGAFTRRDQAAAHLAAGARKVIIGAVSDDADATFVFGVNHRAYEPDRHHVVSNASCTTNCLAPVAAPLHEAIGIEHGMVNTVHSATMGQNLLDGPHRDPRRGRAAGVNMVPTSTGAAAAIGRVVPALAGRLDAMAVRVPTPNVSLVDLVFKASRNTSVDEVNDVLSRAASGPLRGVLGVIDEPLVSSDLNGDPHSAVVDLISTKVIGGDLVKVLSWYDNEWGYSCRMLDLARVVAG